MRLADFIYKTGIFCGKIPNIFPIFRIRQLFFNGYYGSRFASIGVRFRISTPLKFIHGAQYIHIGNDVCIHPFVQIEAIDDKQTTDNYRELYCWSQFCCYS